MARKSFYEKNKDTINFVTAIGLFLLVVVFFSVLKIYLQNDQGIVVAKINDYEIYEKTLDDRHSRLPMDLQKTYTREIVLDQMIQESLLLQKMDELNISASQEETGAKVQEFLDSNNIPEENLDDVLISQGLTKRQFVEAMQAKILVDKLLKIEVFAGLEVTNEESLEYYKKNSQEFVVPELVRVRHVLVSTSNKDEEEARLLAVDVLRQAQNENFDNFCILVELYSEDLQEECGEYEVSEFSGLPEEFVEAAMNLQDGQGTIVKTEYGYHVLQRLGKKPKSIMKFEDVRQSIEALIIKEKRKNAYSTYLDNLREKASVQNFLLDELVEEAQKMPVFSDEDIEAMCIGQVTVLYGANWDAKTKEQLEMFGESAEYLNYVECSVNGFETSSDCIEKGVEAFPTWSVNEKIELGFQSKERLLELTNC